MDANYYKTIQQIKRHRAATLARILAGAYNRWRKKQLDEMKQFIAEEFMAMGGVYVKFLQGVLLKSEFMKRWDNPDKLRIFEQLDTEPIDIETLLKKELSPAKRKQIINLNPVPFAAGSFGQVYYGMHTDGTPIVIKALRPLIRETLKFDLKLLSIFMKRFSKRLFPNADFDLKKPLDDFKAATLRETDYISEANFAAEMYKTYADNPKFIIPKTYLNLCSSNIIVQEYIDGISAAHLVKMKEQGVDVSRYVKHYLGSNLDSQLETLGYEYVLGIFTLPRIQGDPHPGNIKFLTDNRVGLIDFGIIADTPPEKGALYGLIKEYRNLYQGDLNVAGMFGQFMRFFSPELYQALDKINQILPADKQSDNLASDIGTVAAAGFGKKSSSSDVKRMVEDGTILVTINKLTNKDNRFGLIMRMESADMIRAAQTYITLAESLGSPNVLQRVFEKSLAKLEKDHSELITEEENNLSISSAIEIIAAWLERVAERDPRLFSVLSAKMNSQPEAAKEIEQTIKEKL